MPTVLDLRAPVLDMYVNTGEDLQVRYQVDTNLAGATVTFVIVDANDTALVVKDNGPNGGITLEESQPGSGVYNTIVLTADKAEVNTWPTSASYAVKYTKADGTDRYVVYGRIEVTQAPAKEV